MVMFCVILNRFLYVKMELIRFNSLFTRYIMHNIYRILFEVQIWIGVQVDKIIQWKRLINMMRKSSNSQEHFSPDGGQDSSMGSQIVILRVSEESQLEMDSDNLITKQTLKICRYWDPFFFETWREQCLEFLYIRNYQDIESRIY